MISWRTSAAGSKSSITSTRSSRALAGLGGNLADPAARIAEAVQSIAHLPGTAVLARSRLYRSAPWGRAGQPDFVNAACLLETALGAEALLEAFQGIESALGRVPGPRWGPRAIDVDLLAYEDLVLDSPRLTLPHPRFLERSFAVLPAAEVWPQWVHPAAGRTLEELARTLVFSTEAEPIEPP
jgi:2-amino-4-hydroxy-6-hydroxymethyldihydropteridine diphosphokinase